MKDKLLYQTPFVQVKYLDEADVLTTSLAADEDYFNPYWVQGPYNWEGN